MAAVSDAAVRLTEPRPPLGLVVGLCRELRERSVRYCHWKSNEAIDKSANGENDLDLLIDRSSADEFAAILHRHGFKPAHLPPSKRLPGVADWYGLDLASERLVHVHAHYQLIVGDDMTKNVRLPMERAYLDSVYAGALFDLPSAEMELVVFVVRMMLKHTSVDATLMAQGSLSSSERRELAWLEERVDEAVVAEIVAGSLPYIGAELFAECRAVIHHGVGARRRAKAAAQLDRALAEHARSAPLTDARRKVVRRFRFAFVRKVLRRRTRKRLDVGGALIGVVGGDGSGKSSVVATLSRGLGRDLDVRRFHLGKPPRPPVSRVLRSAMRGGRLVGLFRSTRATPAATGEGADYPGNAWALWHLLNARDRAATYGEARRFATGGGIAVCDRYPMAEIAMDGARLSSVSTMPGAGRFARWAGEQEAACYRSIVEPDLLLVLRVDPAVAVARRPEQDSEFVRERNQQVFDADWGASPRRLVIDAGQPIEVVLATVRNAVWSVL